MTTTTPRLIRSSRALYNATFDACCDAPRMTRECECGAEFDSIDVPATAEAVVLDENNVAWYEAPRCAACVLDSLVSVAERLHGVAAAALRSLGVDPAAHPTTTEARALLDDLAATVARRDRAQQPDEPAVYPAGGSPAQARGQ